MYQLDVIKREIFEKGLETKARVYYSIENSDFPESAKTEVPEQILISKRHFGIINSIKLAIGEI